MTSLAEALHGLSPLTARAAAELDNRCETRQFEKSALVSTAGQVCRELYFLHEGLVKLYFDNGDKQFIMRFFAENSIFTGLDSYINQAVSTYSIKALEPTTVFAIRRSQMEMLCARHHCVETAFRKFLSVAALNMMTRVSEMLEQEALARYNNFIQTQGHLLQRISLGDLADYLGITQVSLSRIRAKR